MKTLPYNYKGRPLVPSENGGKRRNGPSPLAVIIVIGVIVFVLLIWGIFKLCSSSTPKEVQPVKKEAAVKPVKKEPKVPSAAAAPSASGRKTEKAVIYVPVSPVGKEVTSGDNSAQKNLMRMYSKAQQCFQNGKYAECRKILRPVFSMISPEHPLYSNAESLLGRSSMALYSSGQEADASEIYKVRRGDNLSVIAHRCSVPAEAIQRANGMGTNDTRLSVGQSLKIPRNIWSIRIDRKTGRLFLYSSDKLFKIYHISEGNSIPEKADGSYRIISKVMNPTWQNGKTAVPAHSRGNILGSRWFGLGAVSGDNVSSTASISIHGTNQPGEPARDSTKPGFFSMSNEDVNELFSLVPAGTAVNISGSR